MKKHLVIIFLSLLVSAVYAQNGESCISGQLTDENMNPIQFANVALFRSGSDGMIEGTATDSVGLFRFNVNEGKYIIKASAIGYENLSVLCGTGDLGRLTMTGKSEKLEEVTVVGARVTEEADHFVVLPDPKEADVAGRNLELLDMQQLPGLKVDVALQNITVDGGSPILQINGKEVSMTRFCNIKADKIKRIEYSNNLGIRYLDRGASGIINVIMKEQEDGGSVIGRLSSAITTGMVDGYVFGSYHRGRSELSVQYSISHRNYNDVPYVMEDHYYQESLRKVDRLQESQSPFRYTDHSVTAEYTFQANDSTTFVTSLRGVLGDSHWKWSGNMIESDNGRIDTSAMGRQTDRNYKMPTLDIFYSQKMRNRQKIEFNVVGQYSSSGYANDLVYTRADTTEKYQTQVDNYGYVVSSEGVYSKQFNKINTRFGLQYQHNFAHNDYVVYNTVSEMSKDNLYLYGEIQGDLWETVNYSIGTGMKLFSVVEGSANKKYIRNLSSARLNWRINSSWSLTASANFAPSLPSLSSMSTVMQKIDDVEATVGNADLKPSDQLSGRLLARYVHSKGWFVNAVVGSYHFFNPIVNTYYYDHGSDLFVSSPINANYYNCMYFSFETGVRQLFKHINISVYGTLRRDKSVGETFSHSNDNFGSGVNAQAYWQKFVMGCNFDMTPSCSLNGEELWYNEMSQNIYLQYAWKDFYFTVNWHCPFNKDGYKYESKGLSAIHQYHHTNWTASNGNMVTVGVAWQINYGKSFAKGRKTLWNGGYDDGMVKQK